MAAAPRTLWSEVRGWREVQISQKPLDGRRGPMIRSFAVKDRIIGLNPFISFFNHLSIYLAGLRMGPDPYVGTHSLWSCGWSFQTS